MQIKMQNKSLPLSGTYYVEILIYYYIYSHMIAHGIHHHEVYEQYGLGEPLMNDIVFAMLACVN